jgi:2,4-dienoyl-CoA reductase-like NADH-dependent reductase (Old Yellow Enzyme family)
VDFVHGLEAAAGGHAKIGIQLCHAGRKASMMPLYPERPIVRAEREDGGWPDDVLGASPVPFKENYVTPRAMTDHDLQAVVEAFAAAARRAVDAGFGTNASYLDLTRCASWRFRTKRKETPR